MVPAHCLLSSSLAISHKKYVRLRESIDDGHNKCMFIRKSSARLYTAFANVRQQNNTTYLRHRDVYRLYALPRMANPHIDWDNHSNEDQGLTDSLESCHLLCEADEHCIQYLWNAESRCLTTSRPNVGQAAANVTSGWILERAQKFYDEAEECHGVERIS